MWETISSGKPSPRKEILLNIDLAPDNEINDMSSLNPPFQGAAIRVDDMKLLMSCPNSTWFKPPELGKLHSNDTVSQIFLGYAIVFSALYDNYRIFPLPGDFTAVCRPKYLKHDSPAVNSPSQIYFKIIHSEKTK